jgi:glucose-6-phosphate 1-dehydrogenase
MSITVPPVSQGPLHKGDPCTLVIFGGLGDLARRKLFPAIYQLALKTLLDDDFRIVAVGIEQQTDETYRAAMKDALQKADDVKNFDAAVWAKLAPHVFWVTGNLTEPTVYGQLHERVKGFEAKISSARQNRLFYLAVPPFLFEPISKNLSQSGLAPRVADAKARPWRRVIVEKPFGRSLATAQALSSSVLSVFAEPQIYRIDHYVGKETVQNILVFRSANAMFEALWSREYISHVQITAAETVGLEGRSKYYETAGVVRDMFQNHLLQMLALTAMEPPETRPPSGSASAGPTYADAIRDEKVKVLRAVKPLVVGGKATAIRAQYTEGTCAGQAVTGYRQEPDVAATSTTPTFAAMRFEIDNDRWRGVPFYLRSGKRMAKRHSEVALFFKPPKKLMYEPCPGEAPKPNVLVLRIQPNDGVTIGFEVKIPGAALALTPGIEVAPVEMDFTYANAFGSEVHPAYETLLLDVMIGDATLFTRTDEVEAAWKITDPLLNLWEGDKGTSIPTYAAGSWGPAEANALIEKDGFAWRNLP